MSTYSANTIKVSWRAFIRSQRVKVAMTLLLCVAVTMPVLAESSDYIIKRAKELQDGHDFAGSTKLLDRYLESHRTCATRNDSINRMNVLMLQASNFYHMGITSHAAELYNDAFKIADATGEKRTEAEICNRLFVLHLFSGNNKLSNGLLTRALDIYRALGDSAGVYKIINNMGIMYYTDGNYKTSLDNYLYALRLAADDDKSKSVIMTNMAETLVAQGRREEADKYLDDAIKLIDSRFDDSDAMQTWLNKAEILIQKGERQKATKILDTISSRVSMRDHDRLIESYNHMANMRLALGDSISGLRWLLDARQLSDSLNARDENHQLQEILVRYNNERINAANRVLELTLERQSTLLYVLAIISILTASFAVYLWFSIRNARKKNRLIESQNKQIFELKETENRLRQQEYENQLDYKNRQLTSYSIDAASISELHKIVIDTLKGAQDDAEEGKSLQPQTESIKKCVDLLQNYNLAKLNEDFKIYFNEVHPDLLRRLSEKHPNLTPNDLRICSYISLGMSSKEIASLTFKEIRSVESSRLRLRKKLGLTREQSLHKYIQEFARDDVNNTAQDS